MKVIFPNGYTTEMKDNVAEKLIKKGAVKKVADSKPEQKVDQAPKK